MIPVPTAVPPSGTASELGLGGTGSADRLLDLTGVAPELLAEPDRGRVLEVGPAGLDDRPELARLGVERGPRSASSAGRRSSSIAIAAASWIAVGITSFEDWHLLTWSFGWTRRPPPSAIRREVGDDLVHVRVRRRSRAGLVDVDRELVVVARRRATSAAAAAIAPRRPASSRPSSAFVSAAASLDSARARMNGRGNRWPEIGKLRTARWVEAPYSASAGTSISPIESRSIRVAASPAIVMTADCRRRATGPGRRDRDPGRDRGDAYVSGS